MFRDYDKAKTMVKDSFGYILDLMNKRQLSYDEIKGLFVETLYQLSKENVKVDEKEFVMPQVLYGPPPFVKEDERVIVGPQVLYGPPPVRKEVWRTGPQVLYGPPPKPLRTDDLLREDFIPGTTIRKPREKGPNETDDQYLEYLSEYYGSFFPNGKDRGARK